MKLAPGPSENPLGLPDFEGSAVAEVATTVGNVGQALTRALEVDPEAWTDGDSFYALVRLDVTGVAFVPCKDNESQKVRRHICRATDVIVCPEGLVDAVDEAVNLTRVKIITAAEPPAPPPDPQITIEQALAEAQAAGGYPTDDIDAGPMVDPSTGEIYADQAAS